MIKRKHGKALKSPINR